MFNPFCTISCSLFKPKQMCDNDLANCFVQIFRFSSCPVSSIESCVQRTLLQSWSKTHHWVLHEFLKSVPAGVRGVVKAKKKKRDVMKCDETLAFV